MTATTQLSQHEKNQIDIWIKKFPSNQRQSAVMMALKVIQAERGYLDEDNMTIVAEYLNMPPVRVYEVASFYSLYVMKPTGRYVIKVCDSLSCCLKGAWDVISFLEKELNIKKNQTTDDKQFTLATAECLAACTDAPVIIINDSKYYRNVTKQSLRALIAEYRDK